MLTIWSCLQKTYDQLLVAMASVAAEDFSGLYVFMYYTGRSWPTFNMKISWTTKGRGLVNSEQQFQEFSLMGQLFPKNAFDKNRQS